jgi:signal transduction histidine kinase
MQNLALALCLSILLLPSLLLRYQPFASFITSAQKHHLARAYCVWFVLLYALDVYFLWQYGPTIRQYKLSLMIGWLPYLFINIYYIPNHLAHHIFVAGMQCIYVMLLHGASALVMLRLFPDEDMVQYYFVETGLFLLFFGLTYHFIKNFFERVFMAQHAINDHKYWRTVCLLPALVVSDVMYLSYNPQILAEDLLVPRLILVPLFVILVYSFSYDMRRMEKGAQMDANNKFLRMQLNSLQENTRLITEANQKMAVIRHDIQHYNRLLATLVKEGKTETALQLITGCDDNILQTSIQSYCYNPIINAALSMYIHKAEQEQLPLTHKVDLPTTMKIDENELAILLSNLLENAFLASKKQPAGAREIKILVRTDARQLLVSVANRFDAPVRLGDDGLPVTHQNGHGLGMRSLALFRDKYQATVLCSQQEGWFKTMIYVANKY